MGKSGGVHNPKKRTKRPKLAAATKEIERSLMGTVATFNLDTFDYENEEFSDLDLLFKDMKKRIEYGVDWASKYVYLALGVAVENWYNDYSPRVYQRTETLYNTPNYYVSGYGGHIFMDMNGELQYVIMDNAEGGLHGHVQIIGNDIRDWRMGGDKGIGIWRELLYFLEHGEWNETNSSQYANVDFIDVSQMINFAFDAGVAVKGKAAFGK